MTATGNARTTVVIATRNRASELKVVLDRLLATTPCPVIVVDNGSDDDTVAVAHRAGRDRVTVVELDDNLGAVARNVGVARSATPYVAFCDDDSWWEPEAVALAERIFDDHPTVGLLAARTVVWPDGRDDAVVAALAASALGHRAGLPGPSILGFLACSALVRKSAFEGAGGFSPLLHFRGEEQLLALDMAGLGWDLCFCPDLVAVHQPSPSRPVRQVQLARTRRNAMLTAWLRRPLPVCYRDTAELVRHAVRDRAHARALGEALRMSPQVWRGRRRLPHWLEADAAALERHG
ncbi:glycosyltransferase family 2 protein [Mycobacterium sp. NPDC003323]